MCIFSQPIYNVSGTNIFARGLADGRQVLVYEMKVAMEGPVAMVLPLPLPADPAEDAVEFIDLSGYSDFFSDMEKGFPILARGGRGRGMVPPQAAVLFQLEVVKVGQFIASFVPTREDFSRLDPRFRLSDAVLDAMVDQAGYSFAVFQLDAPARAPAQQPSEQRGWLERLGFGERTSSAPPKPQPSLGRPPALPRRGSPPSGEKIHPMAFSFPRRNPQQLFFPTMHVHDGEVHRTADFDHSLFCQWDQQPQTPGAWWRNAAGPAHTFLDIERTRGMVSADQPCWKCSLNGEHPNRDTLVS